MIYGFTAEAAAFLFSLLGVLLVMAGIAQDKHGRILKMLGASFLFLAVVLSIIAFIYFFGGALEQSQG